MMNLCTKKISASIGIFVFLALTPQLVYADFLQETLWSAVTGIFGTILALCAWLFDIAINSYVIGFADEYTTSGIGLAIDQGWSLVRDIMNLLFIFGLLYIGFKIILGSDDSSTRKLLVNLIMAALLVNFSLFITKFVVDTSNSLAAQIAMNGFVGDEKEVQISDSGATATRYQVDMSEDLMARLGLSSIFNYENSDSGINNDWGYIFGTAILLIVASFVFAAGAVLLIIRFVALNFYILFSPLMFIGWAFPPLGRHTTEYWRGFLGKAFFAPIYLLFIYFSVSIITALNTNRGLNDFASNSLGNALQNPSGGANAIDRLNSASAFPYFILSIASLIMSLVVAQKLGATGASQAISIGQNMRRGAQNRLKRGAGAATFGTTAWAGQRTVGKGANALSKSRSFQKLAANNKLAAYAYRGTKNTADASFDVRNVGGVGKKLGLGAGYKGGYDSRRKEAEKRETEFHEMLEADMDSSGVKKEVAEKKAPIERRLATIKALHSKDGEIDRQLSTRELSEKISQTEDSIQEKQAELENMLATNQLTTQQRDARVQELDQLINTKESRQLILDHKLEKEKLLQESREMAELTKKENDPKKLLEYRQTISDNNDRVKELTELETLQGEALSDREKLLEARLEQAESEIKYEAQEINMRNLQREADRFDPFESFPADRLAAIQKKFGGEGLKPDAEILRDVLKQYAPNGKNSLDRDVLKGLFQDKLDENRKLTIKELTDKTKTSRQQKAQAEAVVKIMKDQGIDVESDKKAEGASDENN